ncbi:MAG: DNA-directed RNA polymerase subunit K, partial [Candidatus Natronoplasma sp.]
MNRGYTRFEKARIIGARSLQISMGAPTLLPMDETLILTAVDLGG